ncbi:PepSY domain-containing protein [Shouchella sp. 1P09AA]|uniref:PepSY-associated TM helix domain-containing protein n=1 Tax=unclassified Shouchella TaxID=2893065 RepID=UPI00399EF0BB
MKTDTPRSTKRYGTVWRWHFYAGLIIAPILLLLAVTGGLYLFKGNIEAALYSNYYDVTPNPNGITVAPSELIANANQVYDNIETVTSYSPSENPTSSVGIGATFLDGSTGTVYMNPYTGGHLGVLLDQDRIMERLIELHGELMLGTFGDRVVELAASWTLILMASGLYLWWPRRAKPKVYGVWLPRLRKGKRVLVRDLHAVPAAWLSIGITFFVLTGMLWTGFWGNGVQHLATSTGQGYPPSIWVGDAPESLTEDVAESAWAAQKLPAPLSGNAQGYEQVSIDDVVTTGLHQDLHPSYSVYFPRSETGSFTLSAFPDQAKDEATMYIDQYTGAILADYRYDDYGTIGKLMATGITIHKGLEFGLLNQLFGLVICIGLIGIIVSGFIMWRRRKPDGHIGAPKAISIRQSRILIVILAVFALIFPLVALSLVVVFLIDFFLIQKIERLKTFFHA